MLKISPDSANEPCIFFVWPLEIVHTIDEESPLFDMSAADLAKERFEIVAIKPRGRHGDGDALVGRV